MFKITWESSLYCYTVTITEEGFYCVEAVSTHPSVESYSIDLRKCKASTFKAFLDLIDYAGLTEE